MTGEERARKFWHDWYNGEEPRGPGDLYVGNALVDAADVAALTTVLEQVRIETLREVALSLAEHDKFTSAADFVKRRIPPARRTQVEAAPKYPPDTEYE